MYFPRMHSKKEKRIHERIPLPEVKGSIEVSESVKPVTLVNASSEGMCVSGVSVPVGSVVKLAIEDHQGIGEISLYCKVAWASEKKRDKLSGLSLLNTNRVLFQKDLVSFGRLIELAQEQLKQ